MDATFDPMYCLSRNGEPASLLHDPHKGGNL